MNNQQSAEERLRAAGYRPVYRDRPEGRVLRVDAPGPLYVSPQATNPRDVMIESEAIKEMERMAAAEARGRALGRREGREAERADVVAWHLAQAALAQEANDYMVKNGRKPSFMMDGAFNAHVKSVRDIKNREHLDETGKEQP